jgi:protein phosphatase
LGTFSRQATAETFATADFLETIIAEDKSRAATRRIRWATYLAIALTAIFGGGIYGYLWTQSQFYVGADKDSVVIYRGVNGDVGGVPLHAVETDTDIPIAKLPQYLQQAVKMTIPVETYSRAIEVVNRIKNVSQSR